MLPPGPFQSQDNQLLGHTTNRELVFLLNHGATAPFWEKIWGALFTQSKNEVVPGWNFSAAPVILFQHHPHFQDLSLNSQTEIRCSHGLISCKKALMDSDGDEGSHQPVEYHTA